MLVEWRIQHQENYELYSCSYYRDTNQITGNNTLSGICKPTTTIPLQMYNCALIIESCLGYRMKIRTKHLLTRLRSLLISKM